MGRPAEHILLRVKFRQTHFQETHSILLNVSIVHCTGFRLRIFISDYLRHFDTHAHTFTCTVVGIRKPSWPYGIPVNISTPNSEYRFPVTTPWLSSSSGTITSGSILGKSTGLITICPRPFWVNSSKIKNHKCFIILIKFSNENKTNWPEAMHPSGQIQSILKFKHNFSKQKIANKLIQV